MKRTNGAPHKVVVCGTRTFEDYKTLCQVLDRLLQGMNVSAIITGGCKGADELAKRYCIDRGYYHQEIKADWSLLGRKAGPIRNSRMAKIGNCTFAFWDGKSRGTLDMIKKAKDHKHEYIAYYQTEKKYLQVM